MDERQRAQIGAALERREHLVVIDHQRALIGHEVLERGDAAIDDIGHLVEHLLAPPGDRHVEGIVAIRLRSCCPTSGWLRAATGWDWAGRNRPPWWSHRREPRACRSRNHRRIGAHERHFEMGVRIDAARHDVAAGGVERLVARQVRPDLDDPPAIDQHIAFVCAVGSDDRSVLDDFCHSFVPLFLTPWLATHISS
jgi:hypothetical protein